MNIIKLSVRTKIPILLGLFSFCLFLILFLVSEFAFRHWQNPTGKSTIAFKMLGLYLSLIFAGCVSGLAYYLLGFIYKIFRHISSEIQHKDLFASEGRADEFTEETSIIRSIKLALFQAGTGTLGAIGSEDTNWVESKATSLLKLMPDIELKKISGWDISAYPSVVRHANSDYMRILKTKDGFVGILAGHLEGGITEASERLFVHGIFSSFIDTEDTTQHILEKIEKALRHLSLTGLKLSLFGVGAEKDKLQFLHFMDMPVFQFSKHGIQVIEGNGDDSWHAVHDHEFSVADGIEVGDYLVWGSDRTLQEFGLTSFEIMEEFVDYLLDLNPNSSREMLLAIAKKMQGLGKERNLTNPLENLSIFVFRRTK